MDPGSPVSLHLSLLGPLELRVADQPVPVPGTGRRAVLALLAMADGRAVSVDALLDALWRDELPETGTAALHSHISRLRRTLGPAADRLHRVGSGAGSGYALRLAPDELDVAVARRSAALVGAHLHTNPALAAREAAVTLARWRGVALDEFGEVGPLAAVAVGLAELHTTLRDDGFEARLALEDRAVAAELATAAAAEPLRERTAILLMRALAAEGRTAEAMEVGATYRHQLVAETGLDPGPQLAAWEQEVAAGLLAPARRDSSSGARAAIARPRSPMVGRERERAELRRLLGQHTTITLTGPGGVGKTRLALDAAADLAESGRPPVFIALASVTEGDRVPEAVAAALALRITAQPSVASVTDALAGRDLLLVLDNCEHVLDACRELVTELSLRAPGIRVLATSRATLHVPDEHVMRLQPLPVPQSSSLPELARQPAVRAFLEHADRRHSGFVLTVDNAAPLVAILRRLDGLPLAIELAAGQLAVLPVGALQQRVHRALDLLASDRPEDQARHRTLRATIDWSYRLLTPAEQDLLRAMAPFPGGLDLDTVEWLAADVADQGDPLVLLARLVDASLAAVDQLGTGRYLLMDTVRTFLTDELDRLGGRREAEERFLRWVGQTAAELETGLAGTGEAAADRRLRAELPNVRAGLDLARGHGDLDLRVAVTLHLATAALMRDLSELWAWSRELAAERELRGHPREVAVLGSAAEASWLLGDLARAEELAERGLECARESGVPEAMTRRCWSALATVSLFHADFAVSRDRWLHAAQLSEDPGTQLATAAMAAAYDGDRTTARRLLGQARDAPGVSAGPTVAAYLAYAAGEVTADPVEAVVHYTNAVDLARTSGATFVEGVATVGLATARTSVGDVSNAADGFLMLLDYWPATGNHTQLWTTVRNAARLLLDHDRVRAAALLLTAADVAGSASAVGGDSGDPLVRARATVGERLGAEELSAVRAQAAALTVPDLLAVARAELRGLRPPSGTDPVS